MKAEYSALVSSFRFRPYKSIPIIKVSQQRITVKVLGSTPQLFY